jgi:hypothetical protein
MVNHIKGERKMKRIIINIILVSVIFINIVACGEEKQFIYTPAEKPTYKIVPWVNGDIYFMFEDFSETEEDKMREWLMDMEERCENVISFTEVEQDDEGVLIIFKGNGGNYAKVGACSQPESKISDINERVFKHEMMHVLGFDHEFQREDRDVYLTVNYNNLDEKYINNIHVNAALYNLDNHPFDWNSITLSTYRATSFSKNGGVVFEGWASPNPSKLSDGDVRKIISIYGDQNS